MDLKHLFVKPTAEEEALKYKNKNTPPVKQTVSQAKAAGAGTAPKSFDDTPVSTINTASSIPAATDMSDTNRQDAVAFFIKAMNDSVGPDHKPDYLEFTKALDELKSQGTTEEAKYQSIFAMFKIQGITKDTIKTSALKYKDLFEAKRKEFEAALADAQTEHITSRENTIKSLQDRNSEIDAQMQKLTDEKVANDEKAKTLTQEKSDLSKKLAGKKVDFEDVFAEMSSGVDATIEKLDKYLPTPVKA